MLPARRRPTFCAGEDVTDGDVIRLIGRGVALAVHMQIADADTGGGSLKAGAGGGGIHHAVD